MNDPIADLIARAKEQMSSVRLEKKPAFKKRVREEEQYAFYQIMHGSEKFRVYPEEHLWLPDNNLERNKNTFFDTMTAFDPQARLRRQESASVAVHGHSHNTACGTLYLCHMAFYRYTGKRQLDWHRRWDYLYEQ